MDIPNDELGRKTSYGYNEETGEFNRDEDAVIFRGNRKYGIYEEWYSEDPHSLAKRITYKGGTMYGKREGWHENGQKSLMADYVNNMPEGLYQTWHSNGQQERSSTTKNGKFEGSYELWYENGQLEERANYKDGSIDGISEQWYKNGNLKRKHYEKDGFLYGEYLEFYSDGTPLRKFNYNEKGDRDGLQESYHPNGNIASKSFYINGKEEGAAETWSKDGTSYHKVLYKNGKRHGVSETYENDILVSRTSYEEGRLHGLSEEYSKEGYLTSRKEYKNGYLNGVAEFYHYDTHTIASRFNYVNGLRYGLSEIWYGNGQIQARGFFKSENIEGVSMSWYENGQIKAIEEFKDGAREGKVMHFDRYGNFEYIETYKRGRLNGEVLYFEDGNLTTISEFENGIRISERRATEKDLDKYDKSIRRDLQDLLSKEETTDETGTSFRVANENQEIFVSNAQRAVENIKQDKATLDRLNSEPTIKVYRAMQLIDGKLYPSMSAVVDGKLREPSEIGVWEEAEENPELADEKGYFKLNKGNKKSVLARYNPYFHTSRTPLNDQFASAQDRPELVTVEVEVPESELTSGYKAEKAKDSVGSMQWKAGVVQSKLSGKREVILSRWAKPVRIVPDSEVADEIVKMFDGKDITMPSNVVTPSLRAELEKRGVPFVETDNQGKEIEDRTMFSVKQRTEADYQDIENRLGIAAAEYERRMDMASVHHMEAWQDSMRSLLEMQRAIEKETGKPILDYENAYMAENRMSSENFAQMEEWKRKFFRPLEDIYKGFIDRGENQFSIRDYLFAKHGMERNAVMARREAQRLYPNDPLQQIAKESDLKRTKDYSGLKKLMGKDNIPEAISEAQKYVQDFEKKHKAEIAKLWDAIRNATHSQLEVQRASGLLSQEKYEEIKNMYNYYVPLRGFSETTTDEVYDYIDNSPTPYNVPIKTAKGRESVGDDPIANIANMADSGIMQANRNKMKLHFLNMAERHKTNLVTVSEVIYKYNPVAKMWEPTLPALSPNDTIEETLAKIQQHKNKIAQEMLFNPQDYKTEANLKKMGKDIPYKVINKAMLSEHQVLVMREGKQMVMTINGNPRAAQALNGLTNPEVKAEGQRWIQKANRFMAANFTSRNPAFVISNLSRDSIYAVSMVWAKEAPKYARAFMNNMGKVFANMASLMHKYNNGTLDTNVPMEKMFLEFVMNGGQTGYTHLQSVEDYKRQMAKEMKRAAQHKGVRAVTETGRAILNGLENMNKWAENISRFTAYVTSREDGRSISRSISDAKEISVNFNKKGAGNSVAGKFEKGNRLNYLSSQTAQLARGLYIFMNAGIQGMANFAKQAKRHPYKITAMIASSMALGLAAALLSGGGDDEDEYLSLPKYTRRNNLCIKVGDKFVTIPLPIELRAFYGIGELIASRTALGEYYSDAEFAKEFAEQLSQLLPIDVLEGGEGFNIKSFIPSAAKPIVDAILNESWTGIPIYNDSEFVKTYPGWKKAYKGTNDMLVDVSRWLNEHSGGSDYKQGWMDINPAAIEYIAEQYLGGVGTTVNQFLKMGQTATGAMEFEWRNVPVASRFVNSGNETTQIRAIRNSYYDYREEMDAVGKEFNAYMRDLKKPDLPEEEYQRIEQEIDRIVNSPEYDFYLWWKDIGKVINRTKDAGDAEGADELMREAVETYRSWKKGLE